MHEKLLDTDRKVLRIWIFIKKLAFFMEKKIDSKTNLEGQTLHVNVISNITNLFGFRGFEAQCMYNRSLPLVA